MSERVFRPIDRGSGCEWGEWGAIGDKVPTDGRGGGEWGEIHVGDAAIVALARRQHGIVTVAQLLEAGFTRSAVSHRVRRCWLVPVFRGVYQVGPVRAPRGLEMAAVLATGGVLSHHSAAAVWGIRPHDGDVHVSVSGRDQRPRPGLRIHRSLSLNAAVQDGLPLTTPTRTIHDLAACLPQHELDRAVEQAQILHLATRDEIAAELPRRGRRALQAARADEPRVTRSEAERRLLALVKAARLPRPDTNVRVEGYEVDLFWADQRLVVEIDGYAYHGTRQAFERDRARDAALQAAGYRVVRLTWRQIVHDSLAVVVQLTRLLATTASRAPSA